MTFFSQDATIGRIKSSHTTILITASSTERVPTGLLYLEPALVRQAFHNAAVQACAL